MDAVRMMPKMDVLVLVSGDGDYKDLLEYARSQGVRTEIVAFGKTTSHRILDEAEDFLDLGEESKKFLIK